MDQPGLGTGQLRDAINAEVGIGTGRTKVAVAALREAVRILPEGKQKLKHYLQGDALSQDILKLIPEEDQPRVLASVAPEGAESNLSVEEDIS